MLLPEKNDTIVALASARGPAGVAVVRLSGPRARELGWRHFDPRTPADKPPPRKLILGRVLDGEGKPLDEALLVYFPAQASYTGEPVVEFQLHGSPLIVEELLDALVHAGARPAEAGEFTRRAFLSGRIDLSQAEAVADLIAAKSRVAARAAHRRLTGALSEQVGQMQRALVAAMALLEAEIDFPEEQIGRVDPAEVTARLDEALQGADSLLAGHDRARLLARGAVVVIAGRPNAGKSSLLNRLAGSRRALVHEQAGTTRDLIEADVVVEGVPVKLIDTAGLRTPEHEVERQGIDLARETIASADLTIYLIDGEAGATDEDRGNVEALDPPHRVVAWNKADLVEPDDAFTDYGDLAVSALTGFGVAELGNLLVKKLGAESAGGEALLATVRQRELVERARRCLLAAREIAAGGRDHELAAEELREAAQALAGVIGETTTEQVLDVIFSRFCVGK